MYQVPSYNAFLNSNLIHQPKMQYKKEPPQLESITLSTGRTIEYLNSSGKYISVVPSSLSQIHC